MSPTRYLPHVLFTTALCAGGAASADPQKLVILDFDGPRALADSGHDAVVRELGRDHDLVASKTWIDARANATRTVHGPAAWSVAAKRTGVEAVIEGWVQDEGRNKVLTVIVTDASDGKELDQLTIKLPKGELDEPTLRTLRNGLAERLEWVGQSLPPPPPPKDDRPIGPPAKEIAIGPQPPPATPAPETKPEPTPETKPAPTNVATIEAITPDPGWIEKKANAPGKDTPKFRVAGGVGWQSRSLYVGAEEQGDITQYSGVSAKHVSVDAAFYPFPWKKKDGQLSGVGFSFGVDQSLGSTVTFDDGDEVGDYSIDQHSWNAGVHYRAPLGSYFSIDGEVGYGRKTYNIDDAPETFEVPNTAYHYLQAGGHLDMAITDRASVGFGGKYFHVLDSGDISSIDWYGPGKTSGLGIEGSFVVPLPARMFVRGELSYTRFKTSFDGVGEITEDEGVYEAVDSNVAGAVKLGIEF
jgi:hypothetical protein